MSMKMNVRTTIPLLVLLVIMSGLYIFNRLVVPYEQESIAPYGVPFDGKVPVEIIYGDRSKKQIIFTFDAGSGTDSIIPVLETLEKHGVKGTFFMTGKWALSNNNLVRQIVSEGHEIFNHSYNHPHLTWLPDEDVISELKKMDSALFDIVSTSTKPYFRAPYGDRDARILKLAAQAGYRSVYWSIDAKDWMEDEGMTADEVKYNIISNLQPGMIVLMHVGDTITGKILDDTFTAIEQQGYKIVSLTQGL